MGADDCRLHVCLSQPLTAAVLPPPRRRPHRKCGRTMRRRRRRTWSRLGRRGALPMLLLPIGLLVSVCDCLACCLPAAAGAPAHPVSMPPITTLSFPPHCRLALDDMHEYIYKKPAELAAEAGLTLEEHRSRMMARIPRSRGKNI